MPIINLRETYELTAVAASHVLPVTDPYEIYDVTSTGSVSIGGTTAFTASGTLIEGHTYTFRYTANVTSGDITFMGTAMPTILKDKKSTVEAYYNGSSWIVTIIPDFSQNDILDIDNLVNNPGGHVVAKAYSTGLNSANLAGPQTLSTAIIPADTLGGTGASSPYEAFRITAFGECNAVTSKSISINVVTGANTNTLFRNNNTSLVGNFKIEVIVTCTPPGVFQAEAILVGGDQDSTGWTVTNTNWDFSVAQNIQFIVEENTPTGNLVTLRTLRVEKITK